MMSEKLISRDLSFDYMKGVLILLVVWGHIIGFIENPDGSLFDRSTDYVGKMIYSFHMPLFVLVSGYFFNYKIDVPIRKILVKQFKRLLLPELTIDILGLILIFVCWRLFSDKIAIDGHININKLYHYLTSEWFLWCIFFCSITVKIIYDICPKYHWIVYILLWIPLMMTYDSLPSVFFKNQHFIKQFPFFVLGMWFKEHRYQVDKSKSSILSLATILSIVFLVKINILSFGFLKEIYWLSFTIIGYITIKLLYDFGILVKLFIVLGKNTLGIYLFTNYFFSFVLDSLNIHIKLGNDIYNQIGAFILCFPLCLLVCMINAFLRKNEMTKLFFLGEVSNKKMI